MDFIIQGPVYGASHLCVPILRILPQWFGMESGIQQYQSEIDSLPTFLAWGGKSVLGFLSIKKHNAYSAEIYVMGVRPEVRRQSVGRALVDQSQASLKLQGVEYLQVKTLGPSNDDPNYAQTRAFYLSMGFRPLEEFKQIWDENNPCQIFIKRL